MLLRDWTSALSHAQRVISVKFGAWEKLPLLLGGLGHHNPHTAQAIANKCLELAATQPDGMAHPLARLVLQDEEGSLLEEVQAFASGTAQMADLPRLHVVASRLSFVPVVERSIEGRHRSAKQELLLARNLRAPGLSFRLRRQELEALLSRGDMQMEVLSECAQQVAKGTRSAAAVRHALHWHTRPVQQQDLTLKMMKQAVYRCDLASQFSKKATVSKTAWPKRRRLNDDGPVGASVLRASRRSHPQCALHVADVRRSLPNT